MPPPNSILRLIETFERHGEHYKSSGYNEAQLRQEFLDPMFKALGWDMDNEAGYASAYKDVIHEDAIRVGATIKAPDYCFRVGGTRKFFLEAKRPSVRLKLDGQAAYQLRRYAWSAKLPVSILANFDEFAVYDTRIKPKPEDSASIARTFYCTIEQLAERWDEICDIFSRDSVLKGSFDKYADGPKRKRGTAEVDDEFLAEIERWREMLAKNFAVRNAQLSVHDLNFAVQTTIDRIVFLRICEDRGTEDHGTLLGLLNGAHTYDRLRELFVKADDRYNSGLFHFSHGKDEKGEPDSLTLRLLLDDKPLKDIIRNLYYPESPYEFSVLPADILGQVYERFLGKTIRLTAGHQARIEDKPEVKKAGGVYYTPTYIVEFIVANTLGRLLNGPVDKPKIVSLSQAAAIRVLDPACGSGSFLIVAYQYLLDWHLARYVENSATHAKGSKPKIYLSRGREFRLTTSERKRILLNNIFGVDVDRQAVEVTKLSLLLKVLEGETEQVVQRDWLRERERILPDLAANIRCGNSLIGSDFYANNEMFLLDDETQYRINVFDWNKAFSDVMRSGGFNCVIGNPPYIFAREQLTKEEKDYFASKYKLGWEKQNTYLIFMERMLSLLSKHGRAGYIVPNSWLTIESAKHIRAEFVKYLSLVLDLNYAAFKKVAMEPCVFVIDRTESAAPVLCARVQAPSEVSEAKFLGVDREIWVARDSRITFGADIPQDALLASVAKRSPTIAEGFEVLTGLQAYEAGKGTPPQSKEDVRDHVFDRQSKVDNTCLRYLEGRDVGRYWHSWSGMWMRYGPWLSQPRDIALFSRPRVLIREITNRPPYCINATAVQDVFLNNKSILNVLDFDDNIDRLKVLCAILNSRFMSACYQAFAVKAARRIFPKIVIRNLREFPLPPCLVVGKPTTNEHRVIVGLVDRVLLLQQKQLRERNPNTREHLQNQLNAANKQIDSAVYELYGLTEEEAVRVEGSEVQVLADLATG